MKRSLKVFLLVTLLLAVWVNIPLEMMDWTAKIYAAILVVAALGVASFIQIFWKMSKLENHPESLVELQNDIKRCDQFYHSKGT